jgi:hypothetical protein
MVRIVGHCRFARHDLGRAVVRSCDPVSDMSSTRHQRKPCVHFQGMSFRNLVSHHRQMCSYSTTYINMNFLHGFIDDGRFHGGLISTSLCKRFDMQIRKLKMLLKCVWFSC